MEYPRQAGVQTCRRQVESEDGARPSDLGWRVLSLGLIYVIAPAVRKRLVPNSNLQAVTWESVHARCTDLWPADSIHLDFLFPVLS